MTDQFANLALALIVRSKTNPRKNFDQAKLAELASSIGATGVHQPILVRPLPGHRVEETSWCEEHGQQLKRRDVRPTHELVCGERRYRASKLAGVESIPAMIRDLTDDQALEIQIIENLQRDDLTALEEAEGYEQLMAHASLSADQVAAKISKSRSYVYGRLKLIDLSQGCKEAMRKGKIDASRALLIARIPSEGLQKKALEEAMKPDWQGEVSSVRTFQTWLQKNVMLRLDDAPFKIADGRLHGPSCKLCPKRTGAAPDLFADVQSADICTDPDCFHAKSAAHRSQIVAKAEAKGMTVIEGKEAREIFPNSGTSIMRGYSSLSQVRKDCKGGDTEAPTLRDLLGKDAPTPVLIEHPVTKELIEAVPTAESEALLVAKGLLRATREQAKREDEIEELRDAVRDRAENAKHKVRVQAVSDRIRNMPDEDCQGLVSSAALRAWFEARLYVDIDAEEFAEWFGITLNPDLDENETVSLRIRAASTSDLSKALALMMLADDKRYDEGEVPTILNAFASDLKVSTAAAEKTAEAEIKTEVAAKIKAIEAEIKAAKAPLPAAQAISTNAAPSTTKPPAGRKAKMSASEAAQGIADAMADLEAAPAAAPDASQSKPLLERAIVLITDEGKASIRLLKTLGIGTSTAITLMAELETAGHVSACDERGARTVLAAQGALV